MPKLSTAIESGPSMDTALGCTHVIRWHFRCEGRLGDPNGVFVVVAGTSHNAVVFAIDDIGRVFDEDGRKRQHNLTVLGRGATRCSQSAKVDKNFIILKRKNAFQKHYTYQVCDLVIGYEHRLNVSDAAADRGT